MVTLKSLDTQGLQANNRDLGTSKAESSAEYGLGDAAYAQIRRDIIRCVLKPAEEITEGQLALRYGFGKAPVRAALARLAHDKLVIAYRRKGYVVSPITLDYVRDLFGYRAIIEPAAVRLAIGRVDAQKLTELDLICTQGYAPGDRDSEERFLISNKNFHVAIAQASGNSKLSTSLERLLDEMVRLFHVGLALRDRTNEMQSEHKALIEAISAGNADKAATVTLEQINSAEQMVIEAMLSSPRLRQVSITLS